jgi:hypothetical protein
MAQWIRKSYVDTLTLASSSTSEKGGHDRIAGVKTSRQVSDRNADFGRWTIAMSSNVHEAHLAVLVSLVITIDSTNATHASTITS